MSIKSEITRNPVKCKIISVSKDNKTVKLLMPRIVPAKMYLKRLHKHSLLFADSSKFTNLEVGAEVEILPCRRISKMKSWEVTSVISNQR